MPKASTLSTARSIEDVRTIRPVLPVFVRNGPPFAWFEGDRSVESVIATKKATTRHGYVTGEFPGVEPGMVVVSATADALIVNVTPKGLVLNRDILTDGDEYVIGTVNEGHYLTSDVDGYRPGQPSSGRWIAATCHGCKKT